MTGIGDIALGIIIAFAVLGGVLFYVMMKQRTAIEDDKKPSLAPERAPAPASPAPSKPALEIVELHAGQPLVEQLRTHANLAESRGLRPFIEFGAVWCPPSRMFGEALTDPRIKDAMAGVYLIRVDTDAFGGDPLLSEWRVIAVPCFHELNADGQATGHSMTGAAWGADTIENMSAALGRFFG